MSDDHQPGPTADSSGESPDVLPETPAGSEKSVQAETPVGELWLETLVVMCIGVLPHVFLSLATLHWPFLAAVRRSFRYTATSLLVRCVTIAFPVLYLMWRSRTPWREFGVVRVRPLWDTLGALLLAGFDFLLHRKLFFVGWVLYPKLLAREARKVASLFAKPSTPADYGLLLAACLSNGFTEELVMRAYLVTRFEELLGSATGSVVLTAALFALYHAYQGVVGALSAFAFGLISGTAFCWIRRLWPLAMAHALLDFVSLAGRH